MSVTVADCLALPSLRDASVAGGAKGLNKIVASVTVLEYANVSLLGEELFVGNELTITAFVSARDDVDTQCEVTRHIYNLGAAALVLYYIGVIVPKLDKRLIAVADELDMPLITMPPKCMNYRYSDAIAEVMEAILYDKLHDKYFVPTIIERVAQLPEGQRNLDNVLRILRDRFHITIIVADEQMHLVSKASWPVAGAFDAERLIACIEKDKVNLQNEKTAEIEFDEVLISVFYSPIYISRSQKMYVFAATDVEGQSLATPDKNTLMQISESIQLILSMQKYSDWSQNSNFLVNAIMNDDTYRTAQIASQSEIDIKTIRNMWLLTTFDTSEASRTELLTTSRMLQAKGFLSDRYKKVFVGSYNESIICLMNEPSEAEEVESAPFEFMNEICIDGNMLLLSFSNIQALADVRKVYDSTVECRFILKTIYQNRLVFFRQELKFALLCRRIMQQEGNMMKEHMAILEPLLTTRQSSESIETLSVFLLDAGNSIPQTAKLMHVHTSTIKYRLREIRKKLGSDITKLPDAYDLYTAVALRRLNEAI